MFKVPNLVKHLKIRKTKCILFRAFTLVEPRIHQKPQKYYLNLGDFTAPLLGLFP